MNETDKKYRFRFKQFGINDSDCAMKIGTDGVLLGAWADVNNSKNVLDIGSGSGLISLMTAQRSKALITGIEIDPNAAKQSMENINNSPWASRISIINADFIEWVNENDCMYKYDHIVSNPPFFNNGFIAPNSNRAIARHENTLGYDKLISLSHKLLSNNGKLSIISPTERKDDIIFYCELAQMYISRLTEVYSKCGGKITRILWEFTPQKETTIYSQISIRDSQNSYHEQYINLTKDFYLQLN